MKESDGLRMEHSAWERSVMVNAIRKFGARAQKDMAIEEMSELMKALLKQRRAYNEDPLNADKTLSNVYEEIADVQIMLDQLMIMFDCAEAVAGVRVEKLARLQRRLDGGS